MDFFNNSFRSLGMRVTYEDLTEKILVYKADNMGYPMLIQLVKDIIQQEDGCSVHFGFHKLELGKLQRNQERLLLTLATKFFNRMPFDLHAQIILMGSLAGVLQKPVFFQMFIQQISKWCCFKLTYISELHLLVTS